MGSGTTLWEDPNLLEVQARSEGEPRFLLIGKIGDRHWSAVVTYREGHIRLISVRRSRKKEVDNTISIERLDLTPEGPMKQSANAEQRQVVLTRAVARAAERLGMKQSELARALGLSPATISRMYAGDYLLDERTKNWELAALLVRLYRGLDAITTGDERSLKAWMHNPNTELHDVPGHLVGNVAGLARVVEYVDAHRARI